MRTALSMTGEEWAHYPDEIDTLHHLAFGCGPGATIINIGVGFGTSCLAFHEGNPTATIFGIDIAICLPATNYWREAGVPRERIIRILGDSQEMDWPYKVDMVFIDGDHEQQSVYNDYLAWAGKATKWLVFHDYKNPVCCKVAPAVDEIMKRPPDLIGGFIAAYRMG